MIGLAALLFANGCAPDQIRRLDFEAAQRIAKAARDETVLAPEVLREAGYPEAPALIREVARLIRKLNATCPGFPLAAIARDLARRYEMPWPHIEARAERVGKSAVEYGLAMIQFMHVTMLEDARIAGMQSG